MQLTKFREDQNEMKEKRWQEMDMFNLSGKVGLVTGGGSGLGRIFCETLAEFGADVALADIEEEEAHRTAEFVKELGRRSLAIKADVSDPDEVQDIVRETVGKLGTIDILINNAGITTRAYKIGEMPVEDWDRVIAVNLRGVFLCTRAVLPVMVRQGRGNIVNIASVKGIRPLFDIVEIDPGPHYSASKAGVISLTKETALEYARDGIRVNCIAPGWHKGTRLGRWIDPVSGKEGRKRYEETIARVTPMGRRGDPRELKGLILYLTSDASSFVTGQVFVSDGGVCV